MSKGISGHFKGTSGSIANLIKSKAQDFSIPKESTAIIWERLFATQECYEGTVVPRSFEIVVPKSAITPDGMLWTHGNATKHIYEALSAIKKSMPMMLNTNPSLYAQFILYDYYKSLSKAINSGVGFDDMIRVGNWEFIIAKARQGYQYPVVKHALFTGL